VRAQQFVRAIKDDPDQIRADSDARTDCRCPLQSLGPAAMSPDTATRITLRIVAALPTPELRTGAFLAVLTHAVTARSARPGGDLHNGDNLFPLSKA
jgi:hypothetical protein